jgi:sortase A
MDERQDTLNIGSLRLRNEYEMAQAQFRTETSLDKNPRGAAAARARIAALTDVAPLPNYRLGSEHQQAPATPTADLIVDKVKLADQAAATPLVRRRKVPSILVPMITAVGVFLLVLLLFKLPVIVSQVQYTFGPKTPAVATATTASEIIPAADTITIPKINVHAPVNYEPSIQEAAIQTALQTGVVHYGNTAIPGQPGNVAIFGHSSNDWWEPGNFKFVFVLLDKLSPGDKVSLDYGAKRYTYEVTGSKIVEPTAVDVLNPTPTPTLTLITCTPPGTSLRRLVVTAKQIDPLPGKASLVTAPTAQTASPATLTSSPSFINQVGQALNGVFTGFTSLFGANSKASTSANSASQLPAAN